MTPEKMRLIHETILIGLLDDIENGKVKYTTEEVVSFSRSGMQTDEKKFHTLNLTVITPDKETINLWSKAIQALQPEWEEHHIDLPEPDQ